LGEVQREWLKQSLLRAHDTDFKVICVGGQFLNTAAVFENFANWDAERTEILNWIRDNKIHNVIFLTGDRHFAELSTVCLGEGLTVYDFTTSPLTSGVGRPKATIPKIETLVC
jgi:alkaline phosphatase D